MAANDKPFGGRPSQYVLETDETGSFAISGIVGLTLAIEVSKAGYEVIPPADGKVTSSGLFDYGLSSNREKPRPSKDTPVIFTLRKPGIREPLIKVNQRHFRIARDGSPLLISLDPEQAHKVILRCWTNDVSRPEGQRQYDWHLEITAQDGDLVRRTDGLNYEAPAQGYMGSDAIDMPASLPANEWHGIVERSYFIRFNDGVFARVTFEIHAGGDHFVVWSSFMNRGKARESWSKLTHIRRWHLLKHWGKPAGAEDNSSLVFPKHIGMSPINAGPDKNTMIALDFIANATDATTVFTLGSWER